MRLWLIVIAMGVVTYAIRLSFLVLIPHTALPRHIRDALRFVTPAVLAAIILPSVLYAGAAEDLDISAGNERILAAFIAFAVAWIARNVWMTIGVGMTAFWLLKWAGA